MKVSFSSSAQTGYDINAEMKFVFKHAGWLCGTDHDTNIVNYPSSKPRAFVLRRAIKSACNAPEDEDRRSAYDFNGRGALSL